MSAIATSLVVGRWSLANANADAEVLPDNMNPCGKVWFPTKFAAESEIESQHMKPIKPGHVLNGYYCYGCDGYHIGHTKGRP